MQRLKFPSKEIEEVSHLVGLHMFHYTEDWTDAAVRRFIVRAGVENIPNLFDLRRADGFGMTGQAPDLSNLAAFKKRLEKVIAEDSALSLKDLAVGGRELMEIGIPAGPKLGIILQKLFEAVLEDPSQNTKAQLLKIAAAINSNLS